MADRVRQTKVEQLPILNANWYLRFFGVADYESAFIFLKLKMVDLTWWNKNINCPMLIKISMWGFRLFGGDLWKSYDESLISELKGSHKSRFIQIGLIFDSTTAKMDPLFRSTRIKGQMRNQGPKQLLFTNFQQNRIIFLICGHHLGYDIMISNI